MHLSKSERDLILHTIVQQIQQQYVLPEVGKRVSQILMDTLSRKTSDDLSDPQIWMQVINHVLAEHSGDAHLRLLYDPQRAKGDTAETVLEGHFERARRTNFGFIAAKRLAGNIGYLDIRELPPREVAGEIAAGMLAMIAHTGAVILDLRANQGGSFSMVQFLISYFVDEKPRPLSGIHSRTENTTKMQHTLPQVPGKRLLDIPLFVLVSGATFSAGEALAYDLQTMKRGLIVGEATRGGAHLASMLPIADTYILRLPTARAVNPITGDNWEGRGVQPNIECAAVDALMIAHRTALHALLKGATSDNDRNFYEWELENIAAQYNPPAIDSTQLQAYQGTYDEWRITVQGQQLSAHHHTCYHLQVLSEDTFIVDDETRLRFAEDDLIVLYRGGGAERFRRTAS